MRQKHTSFIKIATWALLVFLVACQENIPKNRPILDGAITDPGPTEPPVEPPLVRPDGVIFFKNDFCACKNQRSVLISNSSCTNFCLGKPNTAVATLHFSFTTGDVITTEGYGNVYGWCNNELNVENANPRCVLEAQSDTGDTVTIDIIENMVATNSTNKFSASIEALDASKTWILILKEISSQAKSNAIQFKKIPDNGTIVIPTGPVALQPVTRYACIHRESYLMTLNNGQSSQYYYDRATRLHFNFIERFRPEPLPANNGTLFCHNNQPPNPTLDNSTLPRIDETPGAYTLWSSEDLRFFDTDTSGKRDINEIIERRVRDLGATLSATPNLFFQLKMSSGPIINDAGNTAASGTPLGYFMSYWVDNTSGSSVAYCPTTAHYDGDNLLFRALGSQLQVPTQGVYLAKKESETYTDRDGNTKCLPMDVIIVKESDVKRAWFYVNTSGQRVRPITAASLRSNTIRFFFPFNFTNWDVKSAGQREYTITYPTQLNSGSCSSSSQGNAPDTTSDGGNTNSTNPIATSPIPHDKRFGCIPAPELE